jgi:hypothetical protein
MGGMRMVNEAIKTEAISSGLLIQAADIGAITGKGMDLNFGFCLHFLCYSILGKR